MNPKQIIQITEAHDDLPNLEGKRQENCEICMHMGEGDISSINNYLRKKYAPEIYDQPLSGEEEIKQEEN